MTRIKPAGIRPLAAPGVVCALVVLLAAPVAQAAGKPPLSKARVTTIVDRHEGWVGGVTVDRLGYVYVADFVETVWRLNPNDGDVAPFASGLYGASGNTFDRNGKLYQANFYGHSIVRISRTGEMTTVASEGLNGPVGMVFDDDGNLLICNCNDQSIKKLSSDGEVTTFARSDSFSCPNGITRDDAGDFYVVSFSGPKIVKITPQGETSVFAETGGNGVGHIIFLRGSFFATSFVDNKIYRISRDGEVVHFSGSGERAVVNGPVADASFSNPNGIAADPTGSYLYINDYVGDESATGVGNTPFSLRRIELPRLHKIVRYELETGSPEAAAKAYHGYRNDPANTGEMTEAEINSLGWSYLLKNEYDRAIFVFELNTGSYPGSWQAFGSLGAAYARAGRKRQAITALERSIELNPKNTRAMERLEQLKGGD